MQEEIKPCPFCRRDYEYLVFLQRYNWFMIQCSWCMAQGPRARGEAEAVEAWNRRDYAEANTTQAN